MGSDIITFIGYLKNVVMKALKTHLKAVALFFFFFQGCTVYKSTSVTLEEAVRAETVTRVKTNENETHKYDRVNLENNYYYGLIYKIGDDIKVRLDENKINKVQVKDKTMSIIKTIGIPVCIIGAGFGIFAYGMSR
jgi:hypothetical protein